MLTNKCRVAAAVDGFLLEVGQMPEPADQTEVLGRLEH
jgi:hypothetical protein